VLQLVTDWGGDLSADSTLVRQMMVFSRRPISLSLAQSPANPECYHRILGFIEEMDAEGYRLRAQIAARGSGITLGLDCALNPFMPNAVWQSIAQLPAAEQGATISHAAFRAQLLAAQSAHANPSLIGGSVIAKFDMMFELSEPPDYEPHPDTSIAKRAVAAGCTPEELAYDILVSDNGRGMLSTPFANYSNGSLDAVGVMMADDYTVPGLSEGGAHVGTICAGSFPTTLLQHWVRDRDHGNFSLPYIVARQARATAEAVGLLDRGVLKPGHKADLNVIDLTGLRLHQPEIHHNLPDGGRRMPQRVDGYRHTIVNGMETYRDGEATGPLPGALIRGARSTPDKAAPREKGWSWTSN